MEVATLSSWMYESAATGGGFVGSLVVTHVICVGSILAATELGLPGG